MNLCHVINPFTAPACNFFGPAHARTPLKNSIFSDPITHLLSVQCFLMKIFSHASSKKKTKRLNGMKFRSFIGRF